MLYSHFFVIKLYFMLKTPTMRYAISDIIITLDLSRSYSGKLDGIFKPSVSDIIMSLQCHELKF